MDLILVRKFLSIAFMVFLIIFSVAAQARTATVMESVRFITSSPEFVQIGASDGVAVELRYSTTDNFVGMNLYDEFDGVFLHKIAAKKLFSAVERLRSINPGYRLVIFDALRPRSVQKILWKKVEGTDKEKYVANPSGGSIHNFGFAVDISVLDETGKELDMGTAFDDFNELSQPRLEERFLRDGVLTKKHINNRRLLRRVMTEAGFIQLPLEWWHFDALSKSEVKMKYRIVE